MGDTNVEDNKNVKKSHTNLGPAYKGKTIVLFLVALITIAYADTFKMTFIGALTTLSGISCDLVIVLFSNNGPRQKWPRRIAKIASCITIGICCLIIVYFITRDSQMMLTMRDYYFRTMGEHACLGLWGVKVAILIFSVIGPITEYFYSKPNDELDDEES